MKKYSLIGFILICFTFSSQAQRLYSKQNIAHASQEDLNFYLKQAKSKRTTGIILTAVGPVTYGTLLILANSKNSNMDIGTVGGLFLLGSIGTLVGIPVLIVGSSRVSRVKKALSEKVSVNIAPYIFKNNLAQSNQTGLTLQIKF